MIDTEKIDEAKKLLKELYARMDENDSLNSWQQAMFDVLAWLLDGSDKPELD